MTLSAKITSKGQITIPAAVRKAMGLKPGDRVEFSEQPGGGVTLLRPAGRLEDLVGFLSHLAGDKPLTNEEIDEAISDAIEERYQRVLRGES